jgi:predicted extracellular nuclease
VKCLLTNKKLFMTHYQNKILIFVALCNIFACNLKYWPPVATDSGTKKVPTAALKEDSTIFAFYNVENLFDTEDDPKIDDSEFLPTSKSQWTPERYQKKLEHLAQVIAAMGFPSAIGVCEIENARVLQDLVAQPALKAQGYSFVHYDSPDERGIDVALLYKPSVLSIKSSEPLKVQFTGKDAGDKTRDVLRVNGSLKGGYAVTFYVNHWPSRRGGEAESAMRRKDAATTVRQNVDALFKEDADTKVVILGDLNDEPENESVQTTLGATAYDPISKILPPSDALYDLSALPKKRGLGSYYYNSGWNMLDHIIVNGALLRSTSSIRVDAEETIFKQDFMLFKDPKTGEGRPNRTYSGPKYHGGYSDHLPVLVKVYFK